MGNAVAIIKGEGKSMRRKEKKARIEQIRASLGLSDSQRTPLVLSLLLASIFTTPNLLLSQGNSFNIKVMK